MTETVSATEPTARPTPEPDPTAINGAGHEPVAAVFWDFGGVILSSPFEAFAHYERRESLPEGTIRTINATNPDTNAWARLERSDVSFDEFCILFEAEAEAIGHRVDARQIMSLLHGEVRPEMVEALRRCKDAGFIIACLTNNVRSSDTPSNERETRPEVTEVMAMFDHVTESRHAGVRKPEVRFYAMACEAVGVRPTQVVFLDDLGVNLKPAAAMGMRTIKVSDPHTALQELEGHLGLRLR